MKYTAGAPLNGAADQCKSKYFNTLTAYHRLGEHGAYKDYDKMKNCARSYLCLIDEAKQEFGAVEGFCILLAENIPER